MTPPSSDPFGKYNGREAEYALECLDSENPRNKQQPWVRRLEAAFCQRLGSPYAIAHNSGTSTLHSCLEAVGVGFGDEVLMPAQTVSMLAFVTVAQNAIPVFVDSDPGTFNLSPDDLARKITPRTKAIIAVHMHGLMADMDPIMEAARRHGVPVIEDCAQSPLATYKGRLAGTIGEMASFSFETKKHLSTGEGGMVTTGDADLATKIRKFGGLGYKTLTSGTGLRALLPEDFQNPHFKRHDTHALNYRLPEICAAVGLAQLERADALVARRREVARLFLEALEGCEWIVPQQTPSHSENAYWTFTVRYEGELARGISWRGFYDQVKAAGGDGFYGGLGLIYQEPFLREKTFLRHRLPADHPAFAGRFDYPDGLCPEAEKLQPKLMQFKTNYRDLDQARRQAEILRQTIRRIGI